MTRRDNHPGNRAEAVRQRRKQQSARKTERKVQRVHELPAAQSTPIFIRGGLVGTPVVQRTRTNVRRKIALPLQSGSEMVIPGLPMVRLGWRALSGFIAIALLVFLTLSSLSSLFTVQALTVSGVQRVNPADIGAVLNLKGAPIYTIDPDQVLQRVQEAFPEFYDVKVQVSLPAEVKITLVERQPVIAWQFENLVVWIDQEGNVFPARGTAENLVVIQANAGPPRLKASMTEEEIEAALRSGQPAPENDVWVKDGPVNPAFVQEVLNLKARLPEITAISYNSVDGFGWHDPQHGWNVLFGRRLDDLDQKVLLYQHIRDWLSQQGIRPGLVSVAYLKAPFYRLEQ